MTRYCFATDLQDDPALIAEYENYHQDVWPEVIKSIKDSGIRSMEIYRAGNRLFMMILAEPHFSLEAKASSDAANPKVQEWEKLMWRFQQALPHSTVGQKWMLMDKIFELRD